MLRVNIFLFRGKITKYNMSHKGQIFLLIDFKEKISMFHLACHRWDVGLLLELEMYHPLEEKLLIISEIKAQWNFFVIKWQILKQMDFSETKMPTTTKHLIKNTLHVLRITTSQPGENYITKTATIPT